MNFASKLDELHLKARSYKWLYYFYVFLRIFLAYSFIVSGLVKIMGERFAAGLSANHPMGQYLTALHNTGFYYTFIGITQVLASILLLIPRTVTLGALLYFPIIVNIFLLSYAVRFEGSSFTSPLMVCACLFLICWNYDKIKFILPLSAATTQNNNPIPKPTSKRFPFLFFMGVATVIAIVILFVRFGWDVVPRNSFKDCNSQFEDTNRTTAGAIFCDCIHNQGLPLDSAIRIYKTQPND